MGDIDTKEQKEARPYALPPVSFEFLTESLTLLRFRYVQVMEEAKRTETGPAASQPA